METLDLGLPLYLYADTHDPDAGVRRITYAADKLVAWAYGGKGDAIDKLCLQTYHRDVEAIDAWKEDQFLLLEETWAAVENGIDDDENEKQYALACDAVDREADDKRTQARVRMEARRFELVKLVEQSKEHLTANKPAAQEGDSAGILCALAVAAVLAFVLLS